MKDKPIVYVAGPYRGAGEDVGKNVCMALLAGVHVVKRQGIPLIPHLLHFFHIFHPLPRAEALTIAQAYLKRSDVVYRIDGMSEGAEKEVQLAESLGIPVIGEKTASAPDFSFALSRRMK